MFSANQIYYLFINQGLGLKGTGQRAVSAQILVAHLFHGHHIKIITHTVAGDHTSGQLGCLLDIIGGSCCDAVEDQLLGCTAAGKLAILFSSSSLVIRKCSPSSTCMV